MEHHASSAERDIPIIGLMEVIVQAHDCASLTVTAVALDHLAPLWKPLAAIRLNEETSLIAMDVGVNDEDAVDLL
jgi:hypothetical protein